MGVPVDLEVVMTTAIEPRHHEVVANGLRLHYVEYGSPAPDATPMVLLHGLTSAWGALRRVAEHFSATYHVYALDQRGHGHSARPEDGAYDTDSYLADLDAFVDALGLDRFVLVGQSMGGHHTLGYVARHPERIVAAIVNDISPTPPEPTPEDAANFPDGLHRRFATIDEWLEPRRAANPLTPEWAHQLAAREQLREVEGGFEPLHDPAAATTWRPLDLWAEVRTITRPLLFIRGGRSTILDALTLQEMDMTIPGARSITLEKAGHSTYWDMEHEWLDVATAFLAAHR